MDGWLDVEESELLTLTAWRNCTISGWFERRPEVTVRDWVQNQDRTLSVRTNELFILKRSRHNTIAPVQPWKWSQLYSGTCILWLSSTTVTSALSTLQACPLRTSEEIVWETVAVLRQICRADSRHLRPGYVLPGQVLSPVIQFQATFSTTAGWWLTLTLIN